MEATHTVITGGVHGVALRPFGILTPLPRAGEWLRLAHDGVARFAEGG